MNKLAKYFVVPMLCLASNFAMAANIKDYPRVAVMDFGNKAITSRGLRGHDMAMATEYAIYQLSACGWFDLIDYESLNAIAQMHRINMSGFVDQGTAVQMGRIAGAQFMVIGNVTGLTTKENIAALRAHTANASNAQHVVNANVALRIVDIETGRIVVAGIGKGSSTSTLTEIGFKKYRTRRNVVGENISNTTLNTVVNELSRNNGSSYNKQGSNSSTSQIVNDSKNSNYNKNMFESSIDTFNKNSSMEQGSTYSQYSSEFENAQASVYAKSSSETYKYKKVGKKVLIQSIEGDVNEDGQIDMTDVRAVEYYCIDGNPRIASFNQRNADLNGDGKISIEDAWKLKMLVYGLNKKTYRHVIGDVDSESETGTVDANDEKVLSNYLVGNIPSYINIIEADINTDGQVTLTDMSNLKARSNHVGWTRVAWMNAAAVPQRYVDYNKNHGLYVEMDSPADEELTRTMNDFSAQAQYSRQKYFSAYGRSLAWAREEVSEVRTSDKQSGITENSSSNSTLTDSTVASSNNFQDSGYDTQSINQANNTTTASTTNQYVTYQREEENYSIVIGTVEVSDVQVRNAISKAVRDAIYGKTGIMTTLNNGKQLKIKTGF